MHWQSLVSKYKEPTNRSPRQSCKTRLTADPAVIQLWRLASLKLSSHLSPASHFKSSAGGNKMQGEDASEGTSGRCDLTDRWLEPDPLSQVWAWGWETRCGTVEQTWVHSSAEGVCVWEVSCFSDFIHLNISCSFTHIMRFGKHVWKQWTRCLTCLKNTFLTLWTKDEHLDVNWVFDRQDYSKNVLDSTINKSAELLKQHWCIQYVVPARTQCH